VTEAVAFAFAVRPAGVPPACDGVGVAVVRPDIDRVPPVTERTPAVERTPTDERHARLARGCRPRGCRAPARRVHGRRVRYVIGDEPGQVNGMRWCPRVGAPQHRGS
jgi:hypothetical protein